MQLREIILCFHGWMAWKVEKLTEHEEFCVIVWQDQLLYPICSLFIGGRYDQFKNNLTYTSLPKLL